MKSGHFNYVCKEQEGEVRPIVQLQNCANEPNDPSNLCAHLAVAALNAGLESFSEVHQAIVEYAERHARDHETPLAPL